MSYTQTNSAVKKLLDLDILEQMNHQKRNRLYIYKKYLQILEV
jgi:hypothetical protein